MLNVIKSRLKAAFIGPCVGVGGADALMTGLTHHAFNIEWVGAAVPADLNYNMADWASVGWNPRVPLHTTNKLFSYPGALQYPDEGQAIYNAVKDANIIISWCFPNLKDYVSQFDIPIIEYAQNSDDHARWVVKTNTEVIRYKAACSKAAAEVYPNPKDAVIIYNGIDPARVTPRKGRDYQRQLWNLKPEQKVVLYMGRMVKEKNPLDVIAAITNLPQDHVLLFVGKGYDQEKLYEVASVFAPGRVGFIEPQYHVGDVLAAADCFVLPSDFEGHPLALMEAMLAGVPCVYSDFAVMPELHTMHGEMGLMVPRGCSPKELAAAIQKSTSFDDEVSTLARNARNVVWNNYTISRIAAQWEEYLHLCVADWWRRKYVTEVTPVLPRKLATEAH